MPTVHPPRKRVPFFEVRAAYEELKPDLDAAYRRVMESGRVLLGDELESLEAEFADYCEVKYCVGVGSGLDALSIALRAWEVGEGDEVIVPSMTFIATWLAVSSTGATAVAVEPREDTLNIDVERIEEAISPRTKAIIPVHLFGQPADMDAIRAVAGRHSLRVLEDNAQAQGARYKGKRTGGLGDAAATSFYPGKNLGAFGDGGAITTDDEAVARTARLLRNYGSPSRYEFVSRGFNSRLDELQAAFLRVKLRSLDEWNIRRAHIAAQYRALLNPVASRSPPPPGSVMVPEAPSWAAPVWHQFVIRHGQRDVLQRCLAAEGIETLIHYPTPPHLSLAYGEKPESCDMHRTRGGGWRTCSSGCGLPIAERVAGSVLSLPMGPQLGQSDIEAVAEAVNGILDGEDGV